MVRGVTEQEVQECMLIFPRRHKKYDHHPQHHAAATQTSFRVYFYQVAPKLLLCALSAEYTRREKRECSTSQLTFCASQALVARNNAQDTIKGRVASLCICRWHRMWQFMDLQQREVHR